MYIPNTSCATQSNLQIPTLVLPNLQFALSQSDKISHQKQTLFSGGNSCVPLVASEQSSSGKFDLTERFCRICDSAELSTKWHELPTSMQKKAILNYEFWILNCQLSIDKIFQLSQLSIINYELWILNFELSIVNCKLIFQTC